MISQEQEKIIVEHLRRPENDKAIAQIAALIAKEFEKTGGSAPADMVEQTALLMNMGETDERISHIYEPSYNWKEHPEAIELNKLHGEYSIEMAEKLGIELSEEQKAVIAGHSKGNYSSMVAQIIKAAEVCRATETPRWYRGEKKEAAKSWEEVYSVLREDKELSLGIIALTGNSYGRGKFGPKAKNENTLEEK